MIKDNVRKTALGLIGLLTMLLGFLGYWQVVAREELVNNPYNRRLQLYDQATRRGSVRDIRGRVLAHSINQGEQWKRVFPLGEALAPVTGYVSARLGKTGVEAAFDPYLLGIAGGEELKNNLRRLLGQEPQGLEVFLTLDSSLQELGYRILGGRRGAIVLLEPATGKVRVLVSSPSYDPNRVEEQWDELTNDQENTPLLNRAAQGMYPPGSTFKVATGAAALRKLPQLPEESFPCTGALEVGGYRLTDKAAHGNVDFDRALAVSCNTTFARLGLRTGFKDWYRGAAELGLDKKIPFVLPTSKGRLPDPGQKDEVLLAQSAIGQGPILETPLHMALLAAGVANGGRIMHPLLLERVETRSGQVLKAGKPEVWLTGMDPAIAGKLKQAMLKVVDEGTGTQAAVPGVRVAGKTGSAENPHGAAHAWFIGFAPAEKPMVAVAVIVENGGAGGKVAAPLAGEMLAAALRETR